MMSGRHGIQIVFMLSLSCMAAYIMLHLMLWVSSKHMTKSYGEWKVSTNRNPVVKRKHWQFAEMQDLESVVLPSPQLLVVCLQLARREAWEGGYTNCTGQCNLESALGRDLLATAD